MCGGGGSDIRDDPRKSYLVVAELRSNIYGIHFGIGGLYGQKFVHIFLDGFVWWDGVCDNTD